MMSAGLGQSIPYACQDWTSTKAAYRFLDNNQLKEAQILNGHFHANCDRLAQFGQTVLLLHDTCEFSFQRDQDSQLCQIRRASLDEDRLGHLKHFTVRGLLMHSTLALTLDGLPLGLAGIKFWTRRQQPCLDQYLLKLTQLRGYLARASDPPPGNQISGAALPAYLTSISATSWPKEM